MAHRHHHHDHSPPHDHDHDVHGHHHAGDDPHDQHARPGANQRAYRISITLNLLLTAAELAAGLWLGSMALLADAAHNLSDVAGLLLAAWAARLALRPPDARHTYGYARSTILAALGNAALLLVACGALAVESARRFGAPAELPGIAIAVVAGIAAVVNLMCARLFGGHNHDLNERGAMLHLLADAAVSAAVVVVGLLVWTTGWQWLDPLAGVLLSMVIGWSGFGLLKQALALALDAVPPGLDLMAVRTALAQLPGVQALHDLHVWPLSTTANALTVHLEVAETHAAPAVLAAARDLLADRFGLRHTTIQIEQVACGADCG